MSFEVLWRMIAAGVFFGLWPIVFKQSGLTGLSPMVVTNFVAFNIIVLGITYGYRHESYVVLLNVVSLLVFLGAMLFATRFGNMLPVATLKQYGVLLVAGAFVGCGLLAFLSGLDTATVDSQHGLYVPFVIMLIVQTAVPVLFHVVFNGSSLHPIHYAGIAAALFAIAALSYKPGAV